MAPTLASQDPVGDNARRPPLDLVLSLLATRPPPDPTTATSTAATSATTTHFLRRDRDNFRLSSHEEEDKRRSPHQLYVGILDAVAQAVVTHPGQVAAVAASLAPPRPGSPVHIQFHTTLHITFNHGLSVPTKEQIESRLKRIVKDLEEVVGNLGVSGDGSSSTDKVVEPLGYLITFYEYGRERFLHYYKRWEPRLKEARRLFQEFKVEVELEQHRRTLEARRRYLEHLDATLLWLERLGLVLRMRPDSDWCGIIAAMVGREINKLVELVEVGEDKDSEGSGLVRMYRQFEGYLQLKDNFIPIVRWIGELCSFHLSARKFLSLALSTRFRGVLFGDLDVEVYHQDRSSKAQRQEIECSDGILRETVAYLRRKFDPSFSRDDDDSGRTAHKEEDRELAAIIHRLKNDLEKDPERYLNPTRSVHCEVFLLRCIQTANISILPYIGVSKFSPAVCLPCAVYFEHLGDVGFDSVSVSNSVRGVRGGRKGKGVGEGEGKGEVDPGWRFPVGPVPTTEGVLRDGDREDKKRMEELCDGVRMRLEELLWLYIDEMRNPRRSTGTAGSVKKEPTFIEDPVLEDLLREGYDREELAALGIYI